jgi:hypothetical protein
MEFLRVGEESGEVGAVARLDSYAVGGAPDDRAEPVLLQTSDVSRGLTRRLRPGVHFVIDSEASSAPPTIDY